MTWKKNLHTISRMLMQESRWNNSINSQANKTKTQTNVTISQIVERCRNGSIQAMWAMLEWQEAKLNERDKTHSRLFHQKQPLKTNPGSWMQSSKYRRWPRNKRPKFLQEAQHIKALESPKAMMLKEMEKQPKEEGWSQSQKIPKHLNQVKKTPRDTNMDQKLQNRENPKAMMLKEMDKKPKEGGCSQSQTISKHSNQVKKTPRGTNMDKKPPKQGKP